MLHADSQAGPPQAFSLALSCILLCVSRVRLERLLPLCDPQRSRLLALFALELVGHPEQRAVDHGTVVAGQVHDAGFHDEAAEFDQMPRSLAALDLPCAHVMSCPCDLIPVARRSVAPERHPRCGQQPVQFAAPVLERTRPRALPTPPLYGTFEVKF